MKTNHHNKIEASEQENQVLKDLFEMQQIMTSLIQSKKINQSFEIIELKEKIINYKLDIAFLTIGIFFISIICIIK
jgi:hypothetical protein